MKNEFSAKGNDFSTHELGPVGSMPRPARNPKVVRKNVTRVNGRKTSMLVVDFSRIDASILTPVDLASLNFAPSNPYFYGMQDELS